MPRLFGRAIAVILMGLLGIGGAPPSSASAQNIRAVTLALVERLADSAAVATVIRSPGDDRSTLVLLRERDADPAALATAMMAIFKSRRIHGEVVKSRLVINVHGRRRLESLSPNERRLAGHYFDRLRRANQTQLEGIGTARIVRVAIAPPAPLPARGEQSR